MEVKFNFIKVSKIVSMITVLICSIGIISLSIKGFQPGIEFTGGTAIVIDSTNQQEIATKFSDSFPSENFDIVQISKKNQQGEDVIQCKLTIKNNNVVALNNFLKEHEYKNLSIEAISPDIGAELFYKIFYGFVIALTIIAIYIAIRFDRHYSVGSLCALFHDIIFTLGILSLLNINFSIEIVAGILTIIGYSLNDTIVVYDRIRENVLKYSLDKQIDKTSIVNISLFETLSRTIITSLTTLFVVIILLFFGGNSLMPFAICLIVGVLIGTYSSIFIASPITLFLDKKFPIKELEEEELL